MTTIEQSNEIWRIAESVIEHADRALFYGPPGTGKTTAGVNAGRRTGQTVFKVTMHPEMAAAELEGHFVPHEGDFIWHNGTAIRAWLEGGVLVIDEIDKASGDCESLLYAILDDPSVAALTLSSGKTVFPKPGFKAIATMNGVPDDLPPALLDRFEAAIEIPRPHPEAIAALDERHRNLAQGSTGQQGDRAYSVRSWKAFEKLCIGMSKEDAARAVFGEHRSQEILESLTVVEAVEADEYEPDAIEGEQDDLSDLLNDDE